MPEMLRFCGRRFTVVKRADTACTSADGPMWQVQGAVHLTDVRCDGSAHGGCEAGCLLYWKEEWLKPVVLPQRRNAAAHSTKGKTPGALFGPWNTIDDLLENTARRTKAGGSVETFYCQATAIPEFGRVLPPWDLRQYIRGWRSGNVKISELFGALLKGSIARMRLILPGRCARQPVPARAPSFQPDFQPGEIVEIRPEAEIIATLDAKNRHRGLSFTPEMRELCGRRFRVSRRVHKMIDERTGRMVHLAGGCLILEGAFCRGHRHRFCPRMSHFYWRDIWLRGVRSTSPAMVTTISAMSPTRTAGAIAAEPARTPSMRSMSP